jgi:hypothetical protein
MLSKNEQQKLIASPVVAGQYADSAFEAVRRIAQRHDIFPLPGCLEDALGIKRRRKNTKAANIPNEFLDFFAFIKKKKETMISFR